MFTELQQSAFYWTLSLLNIAAEKFKAPCCSRRNILKYLLQKGELILNMKKLFIWLNSQKRGLDIVVRFVNR